MSYRANKVSWSWPSLKGHINVNIESSLDVDVEALNFMQNMKRRWSF